MKAADRLEFFRRLQQVIPEPTTELEYRTAFELLVAVILSAQATDVGVNKATGRLYRVANTPEAIAALGAQGLKKYIRTIGLYNTKAANIIKTCHILIERHGGEVPRDRKSLEALPGVGRHFPRSKPHRPGARQDPAAGRAKTPARRPAGIPQRCAPLVDPARPIYLQSAQTRLLGMHRAGPLRFQI
jgi:hypothetical protein